VNPSSDEHFLSLLGLVNFFEGSPDSIGPVEGADEGIITVLIFVKIGNFNFFLWFHGLVLKI